MPRISKNTKIVEDNFTIKHYHEGKEYTLEVDFKEGILFKNADTTLQITPEILERIVIKHIALFTKQGADFIMLSNAIVNYREVQNESK
jgi:hypothetical protein